MARFLSNAPRFIASSVYKGTCKLCSWGTAQGSPIYYQSAHKGQKAYVAHQACHEAASSAEKAGVYDKTTVGVQSAQSPEPGCGNGAQTRTIAWYDPNGDIVQTTSFCPPQSSLDPPRPDWAEPSSPQQAPEPQQAPDPQQASEPQQAPEKDERLQASDISGLFLDPEKMNRHMHREDLLRISMATGYCRYVGGKTVTTAKKDDIIQAFYRNAKNTLENEATRERLEDGGMPWAAKHLRRSNTELERILLTRETRSGTPIAPSATAQTQAQVDAQRLEHERQMDALDIKQAVIELAEQAVEAAAAELEVERSKPREIKLVAPDGAVVDVAGQHEKLADLLLLTASGIPVLMVGPAGGGKTHAASIVAEKLNLLFTPLSLGPGTTQSQLFGYCDATGNYVRSPFRETFERGGLVLLDELDRCNERVAVTLNAAIANGRCSFPDGTVERHKDCRIIAAANTVGYGADRQYVSARQQDASLLDRFAVLTWGYDDAFEEALTTATCEVHGPGWLANVRAVRQAAEALGLRYVVSPRASLQGATLLKAGARFELVVDSVLFRGWSDIDRNKVEAEVGLITAAQEG